MRWLFCAIPMGLAGCPSEPSCGLEGTYVGVFEGDEEGSIEVDVTPADEDAQGLVELHMVGPTLELFGEAGVDCTTGSIVMALEDAAGLEVGDALGSLGTIHGSGEWSIFTGPDGTWQY